MQLVEAAAASPATSSGVGTHWVCAGINFCAAVLVMVTMNDGALCIVHLKIKLTAVSL